MTDEEIMMKGAMTMIRSSIGSVLSYGMKPRRIYMNRKTKDCLFRYCMMFVREIVIASPGKKEMLYGVPIAVCNDLEDGEIDVSVDDK